MIKFIIIVVFLLGSITILSAIQPATGANTLRQVQEINGTFPAGVSEFNVTISPPLANLDKSIAFLTFEYNQQNQHRDTFRSWNFTDLSTLTIYGNDATSSANFAVGFHGTIYELTASSDGFVQHLEFIMGAGLPEGEFENSIPTAVNITRSFIVPAGSHHEADDSTVGVEEFTKFRIINSTAYGLEVGDTPNTGDTIYHVSVVDLNRAGVTVQRGQGTLGSGETIDTVTPSAYNKTNSLLFASFNTNGDFSQDPDDVAMKATIDNNNSDLIFERFDSSGTNTIDYSWELIEYETGFLIAQHFNGTIADGDVLDFQKIPTPVGNFSRSWAIGTVSSPFGLGNGLSDSTAVGSFDRSTATITLENATDVELLRGTGTSSYEVGLQVVEFLITALDETETIIDVVTAVDLGTQFIVNKTLADTTTILDQVQTSRIRNVTDSDTVTILDQVQTTLDTITNQTISDIVTIEDVDQPQITVDLGAITDTVTVLDQVQSNVTQNIIPHLVNDTATIQDEVSINGTKILSDIATVLDQVQSNVTTLNDVLLNDTATILDEVNIEGTKQLSDTTAIIDQEQFVITKQLTDTTVIIDIVNSNVTTIIDQDITDTTTVLDQVSFIVNKSAVDIAITIDQGTGKDVTTVLADVVVTQDNVDTNVVTVFNVTDTDTATILDEIELIIGKAIQDSVIVLDGVEVDSTGLFQLNITDIVTVSDPNLAIIITPVLPPSGGGGSGGGGGTPDPTGFQRLIGLDIASEVIEVELSTVVPSDFEITVFGQQTTGIFITGLVTEPQFVTWFNFGEDPRELDFDVTIDQSKTSNDPTRIENIALDDFLVTAPNISCALLDPFDPPQPCLEPIIYEVPVEFEFAKGGVTFHEDHIIIVDARIESLQCEIFGLLYPRIFCQNLSITSFGIVDGGTPNSIPLLFIPIILLAIMTFVVFAFRQAGRGGVRSTTRRKFRKRDELTNMSDRQVRRKFKRGR